MSDPRKYSLWLAPRGEAGHRLQQLVADLAHQYGGPVFVPHLTLVADVQADDAGLPALRDKLTELAQRVSPFTVTLTGYGSTDEEFRCLYLAAAGTNELTAAYRTASEFFPQVYEEHFWNLPHVSVLYGIMPQTSKNDIIVAHPMAPLSFTVAALDLYLTEGPADKWQREAVFALAG